MEKLKAIVGKIIEVCKKIFTSGKKITIGVVAAVLTKEILFAGIAFGTMLTIIALVIALCALLTSKE